MNTDDPRLSAYLHGEMSPEEARAFEAELKTDPQLAAELEAYRKLNGALDRAYREEPLPVTTPMTPVRKTLSPQARAGRLARLKADVPKLGGGRRLNFGAMTTALVAAIALAGLYIVREMADYAAYRSGPDGGMASVSPASEEERNRRLPLAEVIAAQVENEMLEEEQHYDAIAELVASGLGEEWMQDQGLPERRWTEDDLAEFFAAAPRQVSDASDFPRAVPPRNPIVPGEPVGSNRPGPSDTMGGAGITLLGEGERLARAEAKQVSVEEAAVAADQVAASMGRRQTLMAAPAAVTQGRPTFGIPPRPIPVPRLPRTHLPGERYASPGAPSPFLSPERVPLSTFALEVDTASYTNLRRMLQSDRLPPAEAVRIEELINYFDYPVEAHPEADTPFALDFEIAQAPWAPRHQLLRVTLKGEEMPWSERPPSNLVFLIDVSGSMSAANKLPLVKESLSLLVQRLDERDMITIVTYSGAEKVALEPTPASERRTILDTIRSLRAAGSTNGEGGIQRAYELARAHFLEEGNNRVILCTDGDFNVGLNEPEKLVDFIAEKSGEGIFLSVFGFGAGNLRDDILEGITNRGDGQYAYIDGLPEARRLFVQGAAGTLQTIAMDVKIQMEFNPAQVAAYRLIGYENRALPDEAFNDDGVDAGEIGSGHSVTALYEIVPTGVPVPFSEVDELRYQKPAEGAETVTDRSAELLWIKLRYKLPRAETSRRLEQVLPASETTPAWEEASAAFRWAAAVAGFGMQLRKEPQRGELDWELIESLARPVAEDSEAADQLEFLVLIDQARRLQED